MWTLQQTVRIWFDSAFGRRRGERRACLGYDLDWLPPVLGPSDWSIGIMADRSANWYFDREPS